MMPLPMAGKNADKNTDALLLSRTRVATPCHAEWAQMIGDDKSRYCGSCKKNVYNLSAMTGKEATALIREKEGNLCIRYYQRVDGTVMTQDCPVGVAAVKRKITRAFAAVVVGVASGLMLVVEGIRFGTDQPSLFTERLTVWVARISPRTSAAISHTAGAMAPIPVETPAPVETPGAIMGAPAMLGEMAPEPEAMLGRMRIEPTTQDR
ncbi:MAG: hypothetical protein H7145_13690 [Akkermansiaceae bacterium]|nr:hypothetical protein [Armatimonadota bacterium]